MTHRGILSRLLLWISKSDKQFSEALRLWAAGDTRGAICWGRRAARGSDVAKVTVAQWLVHADGDPAATEEAIALLRHSAEAGFTEAQQVLAAWYLHGEGVPRDPRLAYQWTKRAADSGNVVCQIAMVEFLTSGENREPDFDAAMHYAQLAAEAGHSEILAALVQAQNTPQSDGDGSLG